MPDLHFSVADAASVPFAAVPQLAFKVRIEDREGTPAPIQAIVLRCQIRIESTKRRYDGDARPGLIDLFGQPERWSQTIRSMLWTHANVVVPAFAGTTEVELPVACSFDFNLAATRYFHALSDGEIPLCLLFSGTIFYRNDAGALQIAQIPWDREATFRLRVSVWQSMMDHYYPNTAWLCVKREVFERLADFKSRHGIATWDQALERLLERDASATESSVLR